jgi:hypothetical protein
MARRAPQAGDPPNERTPEQELRAILDNLTEEELREFESLRDES